MKGSMVFFVVVNQEDIAVFTWVRVSVEILFTKATVIVPFAKVSLGLRANVMDFKEIIVQI